MQRCCPHRESSLLPRKIAAGILRTKSFQEMFFCAFGIGTTAPANGSFAIATILRETLSSKGRRACYYLRLDWGGQPRPVRRQQLWPAFRASEAGSEVPI